MENPEQQLIRTEDVIGRKVISHKGETLGEIKEIVLNKHNGNSLYMVLAYGGILGLGAKLFAFPWQDFNYDSNEETYVVNLTKDELLAKEDFSSDDWPSKVQSINGDKSEKSKAKKVPSAVKTTKTKPAKPTTKSMGAKKVKSNQKSIASPKQAIQKKAKLKSTKSSKAIHSSG